MQKGKTRLTAAGCSMHRKDRYLPSGNSSGRGGGGGGGSGGGGVGGIQQLISRQELEKNTAVMSRFSSTRARFLYKCNPLSISGTRSKP